MFFLFEIQYSSHLVIYFNNYQTRSLVSTPSSICETSATNYSRILELGDDSFHFNYLSLEIWVSAQRENQKMEEIIASLCAKRKIDRERAAVRLASLIGRIFTNKQHRDSIEGYLCDPLQTRIQKLNWRSMDFLICVKLKSGRAELEVSSDWR